MAPALMCEVPRATLSVGVNLKGEIELRSFMCFRSIEWWSSFVGNNM